MIQKIRTSGFLLCAPHSSEHAAVLPFLKEVGVKIRRLGFSTLKEKTPDSKQLTNMVADVPSPKTDQEKKELDLIINILDLKARLLIAMGNHTLEIHASSEEAFNNIGNVRSDIGRLLSGFQTVKGQRLVYGRDALKRAVVGMQNDSLESEYVKKVEEDLRMNFEEMRKILLEMVVEREKNYLNFEIVEIPGRLVRTHSTYSHLGEMFERLPFTEGQVDAVVDIFIRKRYELLGRDD
ncbi:MAG: hypothetical protein AABX38_05360 [Candidatus Micrarchaeota archaeon]